ncbi:FAD-dependent oxidoreductase [Patescibacteria group bacterium]|nr:FAD-dependent oxidoreductase [Patescibacteria group bacterium]MBU1705643.1 FAD-dependent oxidoreductase [Patescibacteria group bacterium]
MDQFDVVIVGASFSGLTLAHHLPQQYKVLVIDSKPSAGSTVESTGLITSKTRQEFLSFFPIDDYITNRISSICVVSPNFQDHFISSLDHPWIYQTDTKG